MIPEQTLAQIAAANDIVDVIGGYFPLKRAGSAYKALCPFHQEKSPSFTVSPQRQRFHCFGCNAGGSVFDFVAKYENVDFPTAARRLAERAHIPIVEAERSPAEERQGQLRKRLLALHLEAAEWFHRHLLKGAGAAHARAYLKGRGINGDIAQRWKLGYAPDSWDAFTNWARSQGYTGGELIQSGLVSPRDPDNPQSDFYDRFRDRVMFPICNDFGEIIAFSGRIITPDAKGAKYVNSPETLLFKKGDLLFGLHKSKRALMDRGCAIVLEGQLDLITAFEAGIQNVVASQGTAFTEKQARTLKRYVEEVILCFDADNAGQKAAERTLPALLGLDLGIRVVALPPGQDPDSLIRGQGAAAFTGLVAAARDYFDFQIDTHSATPEYATPRGRVKFARTLAGSVQLIADPVLREAVAARVSARLALPLTEFWGMLEQKPKYPARASAAPAARATPAQPLTTSPVGLLTLLALLDRETRHWIATQPWVPQLLELEGAGLLEQILHSDLVADEPASLAAFTSGLGDEEQGVINRLLREKLPEEPLAVARDCWNKQERLNLERRRELLLARLREQNLTPGQATEIQKQILDLQNRLTDISRPLSAPGC